MYVVMYQGVPIAAFDSRDLLVGWLSSRRPSLSMLVVYAMPRNGGGVGLPYPATSFVE